MNLESSVVSVQRTPILMQERHEVATAPQRELKVSQSVQKTAEVAVTPLSQVAACFRQISKTITFVVLWICMGVAQFLGVNKTDAAQMLGLVSPSSEKTRAPAYTASEVEPVQKEEDLSELVTSLFKNAWNETKDHFKTQLKQQPTLMLFGCTILVAMAATGAYEQYRAYFPKITEGKEYWGGHLYSEGTYANNVLINGKKYDSDGRLCEAGSWVDGKLEGPGTHCSYFANRTMSSSLILGCWNGTFVKGISQGNGTLCLYENQNSRDCIDAGWINYDQGKVTSRGFNRTVGPVIQTGEFDEYGRITRGVEELPLERWSGEFTVGERSGAGELCSRDTVEATWNCSQTEYITKFQADMEAIQDMFREIQRDAQKNLERQSLARQGLSYVASFFGFSPVLNSPLTKVLEGNG